MIKYYCDICQKELGHTNKYCNAKELEILKLSKEEKVVYNVVNLLCKDCQMAIVNAQQEAIDKILNKTGD